MPRTVLAVDVGSATITAACAGGTLTQPMILSPKGRDAWPAAVHVDADGNLLSSDTQYGQAHTAITRFTRLLGREAQVINGSARHADTLVDAALTPALRAAETHLGADIDLLVATYPSTWPTQIVEAYRFAITKCAPANAMLVRWSDAIAASTMPPDPFVDCPVTSIDIGARSSSVTMVRVDQAGRARSEYSTTNPRGGWAQIVRPIISEIANNISCDLPKLSEELWWDLAVDKFSRARQDPGGQWAQSAHHDDGSMIIDFPAPLGALTVDYDAITDLIYLGLTDPQSQVTAEAGFPASAGSGDQSLLAQLLDRGPVTGRWTVPGNPHASRPLVELTGGLANDPGIQRAVRDYTASAVTAATTPEHAAVWGAAQLGVRAQSKQISGRR